MAGDNLYNSLRYFLLCVVLTGILSEESLSPGPVVYVINQSNVTFTCFTTRSWNVIYFYDNGMQDNYLASVIFQGNKTNCRPFYTDMQFGADKYYTLPCNIGQPVSIIVRYINASYHNKSISCKVDSEPQVRTTVKIREMLSSTAIDPNGILTIKEGALFSVKCTAKSIPRSTIEWHIIGSTLTGTVANTSPLENTHISTLTYQAKKEHNNRNIFCSANDSFTAMNSSSVNLNIVYIPEIHTEPYYNPYIIYHEQTNIVLTCLVDHANPANGIIYKWIVPSGTILNGQNVTITTVEKSHRGTYSCTATNSAGSSDTKTTEIIVEYIPLIANISGISTTEGTSINVIPQVDANPVTRLVWWTRKSNYSFRHDGLILTISNLQREASGEYTFHAMNVLTPSGLPPMNKTSEKSVTIDVLYVPMIHIEPNYNTYILYDKQENVVLTCIVDHANPANVITYKWITPSGTVNNQNETIRTVEKSHKGDYSCTATNVAGSSDARKIQITVQYIPLIANISDISTTEGTSINVIPQVDANPVTRLVWWTRKNNYSFRHDGLILTINNIQREASGEYTFHAMNVLTPSGLLPMNKTSEKSVTIDVLYVPMIHTEPSSNTYILYHKQENVVLTCIVDHANPANAITYKWITPSGPVKNQNVTIQTVEKSHRGDYSCTATNIAGSSESKKIQITVQYAPKILRLQTLNGTITDELQSVTFQCDVDSNPASNITWIFSKTNTQLKTDEYAFKSNYTILKTSCLQTGSYRCQASNIIGETLVNAFNETDLFVLCSARSDPRYQETQKDIRIMEHEDLNITVFLLAYPEPVISWTITNSETGAISAMIHNNVFNGFEHISTVYISKISKEDYGVYTMNAFNNIGLQYMQSFSVMAQGPPQQPADVLVACDITSMIVSWRPGFNGGTKQTFRVAWLNVKTQNTQYSTEIMASNQGLNKQYIVNSMDSDTMYIIYVEASNKHGIVRSTDTVNCTTGPRLFSSPSNNSLATSLGAGIGSSVLILLVTGLVVFFLKRRSNNKKENNKLYESSQSDKSRQKTNADQHNYSELQTIGIDFNPECLQTNSHNTYEEIGKLDDGRKDYQNVNDHNTDQLNYL